MQIKKNRRLLLAIFLFAILTIATFALSFQLIISDATSGRHNMSILNNSGQPFTDVVLVVGPNTLHIDRIEGGYEYEYYFNTPGNGSLSIHGSFNDIIIKCDIGYIGTAMSTETIVYLDSERHEAIFLASFSEGETLIPCENIVKES